MVLKKLFLQNFRNYSKREFDFSEKTNLIIGPNASGKTNILEAIYFLASGKSIRVKGVEREAIEYGKEIARIIGEIREIGERGGQTTLELVLTTGEVIGEKAGKKKYLVNGVAKRTIDFLGNLRAVYFGPEDLELITDSPGLRRKYLDMVLSQVDREYARSLLSYEKGLRQRNKILESFRLQTTDYGLQHENVESDRRRLYFWDQLLIKNGNYITKKRGEFIDFVNNFQFSIFNLQSISNFQFSIEYDASTISEERLAKYADEEVAAGATLVGPHRDDFRIIIKLSNSQIENDEGRDLAVYGSRGEQRLAILWLKLGELSFVETKTETKPILLLDDIFSELDVRHRGLVFEVLENHQTIITSADLGMVEKRLLEGVKIIEIASPSTSLGIAMTEGG